MTSEAIHITPELQTINREDFWQHHVDQWRKTGMSKAMYCQQHDLVYHQMVYWSTKSAAVNAKPAGGFVPVNLGSDVPDVGLSIRLPNGITIEGFDDHRIEVIAKLIATL